MKKLLFLVAFISMMLANTAKADESWTGTTGSHTFSSWTSTNTPAGSSSSTTITFNSVSGTVLSLSYSIDGDYSDELIITLDGQRLVSAKKSYNYFTDWKFTSSGTHKLVCTVQRKGTTSYGSSGTCRVTVSNIIVNHSPSGQSVLSATNAEGGDLKYYIDETNRISIKKLVVSGPLNGDDMNLIRYMAKNGVLEELNMQNTTMVEGGKIVGSYSPYHESESSISQRANKIAGGLFDYCTTLKKVVLPNSIDEIGVMAFRDCKNLSQVTLGTGVEIIGREAFWGCPIETLTIPENVKHINHAAFIGCPISNLYLNDGLETIGYSSFAGIKIQSLSVPKTVTYIGDYTCYGEYLDYDDYTESSFRNCTNLKSVTFESGFRGKLGNNTFVDCSSIERVNCASLEDWCNITFGDYQYLNHYNSDYSDFGTSSNAAASCKSNPTYYSHKLYINGKLLTEADIPDTLTRISNAAFVNCEGLKIVKIPASIKEVGAHAFEGCSGITQVHTTDLDAWSQIKFSVVADRSYKCDENGNPIKFWDDDDYSSYYATIHKALVNSNPLYWTNKLYCNGEIVENIELSEGISKIQSGTFAYLDNINTLSLPSTLKEIGQLAFEGCNLIPKLYVESEKQWNEVSFEHWKSESSDITDIQMGPNGATNWKEISVDLLSSKPSYEKIIYRQYTIDGDNGEQVEVNHDTMTYTRTFTENNVGTWQAWFVPFELNPADYKDDFSFARIYMMAYVNPSTHQFVSNANAGELAMILSYIEDGETLKAGTPYALMPKAAGTYSFDSCDGVLHSLEETHALQCSTTSETFTFSGQYEATESCPAGWYAIASKGGFINAEGKKLSPFRWHFTVTSTGYGAAAEPASIANARIYMLGEDSLTGLTGVEGSQQTGTPVLYDLQGRQFNKAANGSPAHGMLIINGKKLIK